MGIKEKYQFKFIAIAPTGSGLSGSDRIFIELARNWSKTIPISIYTTQEGVEMVKRQKLSGMYLKIHKVEKRRLPRNFFLKYIYKIILGVKLGLSLRNSIINDVYTLLYSSSDFWMDVFPAMLIKSKNSKCIWVATWFQTAPNPLKGFVEGSVKKRYRSYSLYYWLSQLLIKPIIDKYADYIVVNNEEERKQFLEKDNKGKVFVLLGAVRIENIQAWKLKLGKEDKKYDAVFQGRFHPQKGVVELIEIWKKVVERIPEAKLAMIGDGPLMKDVIKKIEELELDNNIKLYGYLFDGYEKYNIFSQSKIVVHPSFYDSGGMASAEAMAFSIPCVGFNLKAYQSYYPQGMKKVEIGNIEKFAQEIVNLLRNDNERLRLGELAYKNIKHNWSWKKRSGQLFDFINITNKKNIS